MNKLAYFGGEKVIKDSWPHFNWPILSDNTIKEVNDYLVNRGPLSIADGSGIIKELEDKIRNYVGTKHVLSTNSASNALHSAYVSLDLDIGSEVIVQNITFQASITPAIHCGLTPILVDVNPDNGNISIDALEKAITNKTKAVVINHNWGHPADMDEILVICKKYKLKLIEDCSHSFGATYKGRKVGTFGDIAVASMQASKTLTAGEGGLFMTNNDLYYERACLTGHYRGRSEFDVKDSRLRPFVDTGLGLKYRMHPLAAVIASNEFEDFDKKISNRACLLKKLSDGLQSIKGIKPPIINKDVTMGSFYGYKPEYIEGELILDNKPLTCDDYIKILNSEGVDIHRPSVKPLSELPIFYNNDIPFKFANATWKPRISGNLIGCEKYFKNRLSLPTFTNPESEVIVDLYLKAFKKVADALGK